MAQFLQPMKQSNMLWKLLREATVQPQTVAPQATSAETQMAAAQPMGTNQFAQYLQPNYSGSLAQLQRANWSSPFGGF